MSFIGHTFRAPLLGSRWRRSGATGDGLPCRLIHKMLAVDGVATHAGFHRGGKGLERRGGVPGFCRGDDGISGVMKVEGQLGEAGSAGPMCEHI
jgi:hypothetical protein